MGEGANTILESIIAARRRRLEQTQSSVSLEQIERAAARRTERRDFVAALSGDRLRVVAELKKASPSAGVLREDYQPQEVARRYEAGGASALSVLTEETYFQGSLDDLGRARRTVRLPVLRKDFILDSYQVYESVAAGADALLLIVAVLSDHDLRHLTELSGRLRLAALVEVHDEGELARALAAGARIIGVNNRDLKTLEVDLETSFRLRPLIPVHCLAVSESGIKTREDLLRLAEAGFNAVLIGERLMSAPDPGRALGELLEGARSLAAQRL